MLRGWKKLGLPAGVLIAAACMCAAVALAGSGKLTFVDAQVQGTNGIDGLQEPDDVAVSPDGKDVYAAANSGGVVTFKRSKDTGELTFVNAKFNGQDGVTNLTEPENVAISADGRSVYVTSPTDGAVAVFKRSTKSGKLSFVESDVDGQRGVTGLDNPWAIVVAPDGRNVYVSDDNLDGGGVVAFKRDRHSGKLEFVQDFPGPASDSLNWAQGITTSPDGRRVYLAANQQGTLTTFKRKAKSGKLKLIDMQEQGQHGVDGIAGAFEPVVSGDGKSLYVSDESGNAITTFKLDKQSGKPTFVQALFDGPGVEIPDPMDEVVSGDGKNVYVAFNDNGGIAGISTFKRDPQNGKLTYVRTLRDGTGGVSAEGLWRVAISPDDRSLYTADYTGSSVALFKRSK